MKHDIVLVLERSEGLLGPVAKVKKTCRDLGYRIRVVGAAEEKQVKEIISVLNESRYVEVPS